MRLSTWFPFRPPVDEGDAAPRVHLVNTFWFGWCDCREPGCQVWGEWGANGLKMKHRARTRNITLSGGDIWFLLVVVEVDGYNSEHYICISLWVCSVCGEANGVKKHWGPKLWFRCRDAPIKQSHQSQWGHPSTKLRRFFLTDLIDCWWLALMDMWPHTHMRSSAHTHQRAGYHIHIA